MNERTNPDVLLSRLKAEELKDKHGRLKIFFGATAGVGKTYAMLQAAQKLKGQHIDVVGGYIETHGRQETEALLTGLEILPSKLVEYKGTYLKEFDLDAALARKPAIILVDELAHTNAPDSRHVKRWQDVQELLEAGIDVYTTINVQHVESLHDVVAQITNISVNERVPDSLLEKADEIELVDLPPDELLERLREGKVYVEQQAQAAMDNFFRKGNLIALRELALRYTADRVVAEMETYKEVHAIKSPWTATDRLLVCVSSSPLSIRLVRAAKRMSEALHGKWMVLYVEGPREVQILPKNRNRVMQTLRLAQQLGADILESSGQNVAQEIMKYAIQHNVTKIIIGKPARPRWRDCIFGSVVDDVIRQSGAIDVYVITGDEAELLLPSSAAHNSNQQSVYIKTILTVAFFTCIAELMLPYFELSNVVMSYLLAIVIVATRYGRGPSILASILSVAAFDFFCVPPYFSFSVRDTQNVVTFFVMLVVAIVISNLTFTTKKQAEAAKVRETRTAALYSMSKELSSTLDMDSLVSIGLRHIGNVFNSQVALLITTPDGQLSLLSKGDGKHSLTNPRIGVAAWVQQNRRSAGLGTDTIPGAKELYIPLIGAQKNIGVLAVKPENEDEFLSPERLRLLESFANQIALACERAQSPRQNELV